MMREETQKACEDKKKSSFIFMSSSSTSLACALRDVVIIVVDFLCVFFFWLNAPLHTSNIIVHYREMQSAPITEKLGEKIQLTPSPFARTC